MNSLKMAWRKLFRKGEHSLTRIISLIAGLAFGMLLLSEVFYNYSFDSFYPDANRIYLVRENFKSDKSSEKISTYGTVSGAIAPGLKVEVPGIQAASRLNSIGASVFYTDDKKSYKGEFSFSDENVFDVLPRKVIYGNPKEILKTPMNCMVSDPESLAPAVRKMQEVHQDIVHLESIQNGMVLNKLSTVLNELKVMPQIETVGLGFCIPTERASGNNVSLPGAEKELFNIADFYWIDESYLSVLNIKVSEGSNFSSESCIPNDFLISRKGADMLIIDNTWKDGVIGKQITLSEHGTNTIRGIFPDFIIHSITFADQRPAMFSYLPDSKFQEMIEKNPSVSCYILIKTHEGTQAEIIKKITAILNIALPHQDAVVKSLESEKTSLYASEEGFRTAMFAGNVIILLITLLGLLGYIATEVSRRSKELAIRKISGARLSDILKMFIKDLEYLGLPAVIAGLAGASLAARKWIENFVYKSPLHWEIFVLCGLLVLLFIAFISALYYIIIANRNPVEALRHE